MTDGYWNRQQSSILPTGVLPKRPRSDYDATPSGLPSSHMSNYYARDDESARIQTVKDTKTIGSAYDRYLQNAVQAPPFASGDASALSGVGMARSIGGGMAGYHVPDPTIAARPRAAELDLAPNGRESGLIGQAPLDMLPRPVCDTVPLPPDASNTLYVEGLPSDCRRREVAHIFRPFVGYREVRLVNKEARARGGDPITLCFVDFENAACAATAMSALQGYKMDELDPDSKSLRLQFSRNPGPRSGSGSRGRR